MGDQQQHEPRDLRGRHVRFRIKDARVPEPGEILAELHDLDLLCGQVTDLTDSGAEREAFAVVEVKELAQAVIVPTRCLEETS